MTDMYSEVPEVPIDVRTCPVHGGADRDDGAMPINRDLLLKVVVSTALASCCHAQMASRS